MTLRMTRLACNGYDNKQQMDTWVRLHYAHISPSRGDHENGDLYRVDKIVVYERKYIKISRNYKQKTTYFIPY